MNNELIYEGKAKKIYKTENDNQVIAYFKDEITAFNGIKKAIINDKGILNNNISSLIFEYLESRGIKTHFIKKIDDRSQLCRKVRIIPLEFICRNYIAGNMAKRLGLEEGFKLERPVLEICYKNDDLNDPLINDDHALALNLVKKDDLEKCYELIIEIDQYLIELFDSININLVDFKVEFGLDDDNNIILADEFSPDNCRLWEKETNRKLDKDVFRRDLDDLRVTYLDILNRLEKRLKEV